MAEIDRIDIGALFDGPSHHRVAVDARIARAMRTQGSFSVHNFPRANRLGAWAGTMLRFFELTDEEKYEIAVKTVNPDGARIYRGYESREPSRDDLAFNEMFDIGPDKPWPGPSVPGMEIFAEQNVWPAREPADGWREAMQSYYRCQQAVGMAVMLSAGRAVGFTDKDLGARFERGNSTLRLLNYPRLPDAVTATEQFPALFAEEDPDLRLSFGRHVDSSGISLLWQNQPGLQAQGNDGRWRDIMPSEEAVSVHIGTVVSLLSGGRIPATPHRVVDMGGARRSIGFFLEPALDAVLQPVNQAPSVVDGAHPASNTYGWHLQRTFHQRTRYQDLVPMPA